MIMNTHQSSYCPSAGATSKDLKHLALKRSLTLERSREGRVAFILHVAPFITYCGNTTPFYLCRYATLTVNYLMSSCVMSHVPWDDIPFSSTFTRCSSGGDRLIVPEGDDSTLPLQDSGQRTMILARYTVQPMNEFSSDLVEAKEDGGHCVWFWWLSSSKMKMNDNDSLPALKRMLEKMGSSTVIRSVVVRIWHALVGFEEEGTHSSCPCVLGCRIEFRCGEDYALGMVLWWCTKFHSHTALVRPTHHLGSSAVTKPHHSFVEGGGIKMKGESDHAFMLFMPRHYLMEKAVFGVIS
ncbi:hypothetical protein ACLOJK_018411, partial [Asimina triloba]